MQAFEQHGFQHADVFSQRSVRCVGRLGKRLLQRLVDFCINGDFDHLLPHVVRTREILEFTRI